MWAGVPTVGHSSDERGRRRRYHTANAGRSLATTSTASDFNVGDIDIDVSGALNLVVFRVAYCTVLTHCTQATVPPAAQNTSVSYVRILASND